MLKVHDCWWYQQIPETRFYTWPMTIQALDILDLHEHLTIYNSGSIGLAREKTSNSDFYGVRNVDDARHLLLSLERPAAHQGQPTNGTVGNGHCGTTTCDCSG